MFIDEKEAERRLKDNSNLLNILQREKEEDSSSIEKENSQDVPPENVPTENPTSVNSEKQSSSSNNNNNDEYSDIVSGVLYGTNGERRGAYGIKDPRKGNRTNHVNAGRKNGSLAVPNSIKTLAGIMAHVNTVREVAEELGISQSAVNSYKHGKNTSADPVGANPELTKAVRSGVGEVHDLAIAKTKHMLGLITEDELNAIASVKEKVKVVEGLANVVNKTAPRLLEPKKDNEGPQFIFIAPSAPNKEDIYGAPVTIYVEDSSNTNP